MQSQLIVFNFKVNYVRGIKIEIWDGTGGTNERTDRDGYRSPSAGTSGLKMSSIFHFWLVDDGWTSQILCVKLVFCLPWRLSFRSEFSNDSNSVSNILKNSGSSGISYLNWNQIEIHEVSWKNSEVIYFFHNNSWRILITSCLLTNINLCLEQICMGKAED